MPDRKTCYVSDDSGGAVLTKFVAARSGDLTAGTLFAAKATQVSSFSCKRCYWTKDCFSILQGSDC
jgi:hypothetical protein